MQIIDFECFRYAMARELISAYPIFGDQISEADKILSDLGAEWSLVGMCFLLSSRV